jgi:hypothetical protein
MNKTGLLLICVTSLLFIAINGYQQSDSIRIMVNKVSPFVNPTESYRYYDLPFCAPENPFEESQSIGEKLTGNRKMSSLYSASFGVNTGKIEVCEKTFTPEDLELFRKAIRSNYYFEMFVEDVPVGTAVGVYKDNRYYLANHLRFVIWHNQDKGKLVTAQVTYGEFDLIDITNPLTTPVGFYYTVSWKQTTEESVINTGFDTFFNDDGHWFSIVNSFVLVTLLIVIVWQILIKTDTSTNQQIDLETSTGGSSNAEESGWKTIRVEVFKCPPSREVISSAVGSGIQLVLIMVVLFFLGAFGVYYKSRGSLATAGILLYAFTAACSGLVSARIYHYLGGNHWGWNLILTASLLPVPLFIISLVLNNFAWASHSTSALPISSIAFIFAMWIVVTCPLTITGGICGRNRMEETLVDVGDKLPKLPKPIPRQPIYMRFIPSVLISGILPFGALSVELDYIFNSLWGHKVYTMWGVIFLVFVMVLNMTACISIIQTYFQLNSKDYRWWWRSFFIGGSTAFYVFLYALYFYIKKSAMVGFLQAAFFVGYTTILCLVILLMLGSVGFLSSMAFVKYIYERSKTE